MLGSNNENNMLLESLDALNSSNSNNNNNNKTTTDELQTPDNTNKQDKIDLNSMMVDDDDLSFAYLGEEFFNTVYNQDSKTKNKKTEGAGDDKYESNSSNDNDEDEEDNAGDEADDDDNDDDDDDEDEEGDEDEDEDDGAEEPKTRKSSLKKGSSTTKDNKANNNSTGDDEADDEEQKPYLPKLKTSIIQMVLNINSVLIKLCKEFQNSGLVDDPQYAIYQIRLQSNLVYLAAVADHYLVHPLKLQPSLLDPIPPLPSTVLPPNVNQNCSGETTTLLENGNSSAKSTTTSKAPISLSSTNLQSTSTTKSIPNNANIPTNTNITPPSNTNTTTTTTTTNKSNSDNNKVGKTEIHDQLRQARSIYDMYTKMYLPQQMELSKKAKQQLKEQEQAEYNLLEGKDKRQGVVNFLQSHRIDNYQPPRPSDLTNPKNYKPFPPFQLPKGVDLPSGYNKDQQVVGGSGGFKKETNNSNTNITATTASAGGVAIAMGSSSSNSNSGGGGGSTGIGEQQL
ncbi:hypothetical protein H4219_005808 [Mycoemilia scoparia]|uniref:SS18 N-terminal domain-containing protein n=1 Tax=Mycoemilia scoparia TaxID=417184 RepID=A0A9W7ZSB2_9FUNG|nr:hypothetical protein H4219_005808 [Mycoemilia scoparia]